MNEILDCCKKLSSVPTCLLVRKDEVKQKLQSLTATAAATPKTSCAAQAQPTAFKPTAVRASRVALPYSPSATVRAQARKSPRAPRSPG